MQRPSILKHLRDIIILPFTVAVIIPYLCYNKNQTLFSDSGFFKVLGLVLLSSGVLLFLWSVYLFWAFGKGTLAPWTATHHGLLQRSVDVGIAVQGAHCVSQPGEHVAWS